MATLEKIRSKSVLLIIIIGVALLAFIVGDALTNSRNLFGDHTTVAKVGNVKIDYTEYQRKREELNQRLEQARQQNPAQYANFDTQLLAQMAIDELIGTRLLDQAAKAAGLKSTPEQLRFYVMEQPVNQQDLSDILRQLNQAGVSVTTPQQAYEAIFKPQTVGMTDAQMEPFQRAWLAMEEETKKMVVRNGYQRLVYGSIKANALDRKALHEDFVATTNVNLAFQPYGQVDEKKYKVTDAEIAKVYEEEKDMFRVEEASKDISFIAVNIAPSDADRAASKALAQKTLKALSDSASNGLPATIRKEGVSDNRREVRLSDLAAGPVKEYVTTAAPGAVSLVSDNFRGFTIVKMGKRVSEVDSIQLNIVQVAGNTLPKKVLASLNGGLAIDSISTKFSPDSVVAQSEQWIPLFGKDGRNSGIEQSQLDTLNAAGGRYIELVTSPQGSLIAQVVKRSAPKEIVSYEEFDYELVPSTKTVNDALGKFEKFIAKNNTAEKFAKNASTDGYHAMNLTLSQSSPAIPRMPGYSQYFPESRQVVRWVMIDGEPGEVSHIYECKDASAPVLYAAAVLSEYEEFVPLSNTDVKEVMTRMARNSKYGDELVKKAKAAGNNLAAAAKAIGTQPNRLSTVRMGRGTGVNDSKVLGRINGSKPSKNVVVLKGKDGVYVYTVDAKGRENFPFNEQSYDQQYMQVVSPDFKAMLIGAEKVKNNAYKFEAGD